MLLCSRFVRRHPDVELLSSQTVFEGRILELRREAVRLPSGLEQELEVIEHSGAVAIAAELDDGALVLVRQYRHATGEWLDEIPAGRLEPGEDPLGAARRELEEETGLRAEEWELLARFYPAPGFSSEWMHLFGARALRPVPGGGLAQDADEEIEVVRRGPEDVLRTARDAKTLVAAGLVLQKRRART